MAGKYVLDHWRRRFIRRVLTATGFVQLPVALAVGCIAVRAWGYAFAIPSVIILTILLNLPLLRVLLRGRDDVRSARLRVWLVDGPYSLHLCASLFSAAFLYVILIYAGVTGAYLRAAYWALWVYLGAWALALYGSIIRRFWVKTTTHTIALSSQTKTSSSRLVIAQLSDIHVGPYLPRWYYLSLTQKVARIRPDVVVVTGDMITDGPGYIDELKEFTTHLVQAVAPAKVYACMGNHDYYGVTEHVAEVWQASGAILLRNDSTALTDTVMLAAIDDLASQRSVLEQALAQREKYQHCVLLAHDPASFPTIAQRGDVDLVLSGHTHAGQLAVPFFTRLNLARLRERYTYGRYQIGTTQMYVHPGNGTSGPPIRFGTAPEIAVFILQS